MIYIEKNGLPKAIREAIIKIEKSNEWKDIPFDDTESIREVFDNQFPKGMMKEHLVDEQHGLCAYCMRRIDKGMHTRLEHWMPLSKDKSGALEYHNLFCVCSGGSDLENARDRVLCCDAKKGELPLHVSPLNRDQMRKIAYRKDGTIVTNPYDQKIENDFNQVLQLNGVHDERGNFLVDTATEIVKGRRDAWNRVDAILRRLDKDGKCTSSNLGKIIDKFQEEKYWEEYIGVLLFRLRKKQHELETRGC